MSNVDYEAEAAELFRQLQARNDEAFWRVTWEHLPFRGKGIDDVRAATLTLADAQEVVARGHGFEDWRHLQQFVSDFESHREFETAADAVVNGDIATLRTMLQHNPELIRARSGRRHHATLLHYIGANGVENIRQKTPKNAVEVATLLLDAGADPNALADMYDEQCAVIGMLVSSSHPAEAGLQTALAELLVDRGALLENPGSKWNSAILTGLIFGFAETAEALARRSGTVNSLPIAAGLGHIDDVARLLPDADAVARHQALSIAAPHGRTEVVRMLLNAGENPDRYNPDGFHTHTTPIHQAALNGHLDTVRVLVEHGARLDQRDTIYNATPLGWAEYAGHNEIAEYLRRT